MSAGGMQDRFWNRVMFPIIGCKQPGYRLRRPGHGQGEPKYLNSPETKIFDKKPEPVRIKCGQDFQKALSDYL